MPARRLLAGVVGLLGTVVLAASLAGAASAPSPNLTARTTSGKLLTANPQLHSGEIVELTVTGFAASADVVVRLGGTTATSHLQADGRGVTRYSYQVPTEPDGTTELLTFSGPALKGSPATQPTSVNRAHIDALVPTIGLFPFHLGPVATTSPTSSPSSGSASPGTSPGSSGGHSASPTGGQSGGGQPAGTGIDVVGFAVLAAVLLILGAAVLVATRVGRPRRG